MEKAVGQLPRTDGIDPIELNKEIERARMQANQLQAYAERFNKEINDGQYHDQEIKLPFYISNAMSILRTEKKQK